MHATQQDHPFDRLPADDIAATILHEADLHTRLVCRNRRDLHPQLTALAPHGLATPEALTASLASLPSSLTSLDLSHVGHGLLTPACLAAVATAAPRLEELKLCRVPDSLLPAVLNTMSSCTKLHSISITFGMGYSYTTATRRWLHALSQPPIVARLRSLTVPPFLDALRTAPASTFPHLTALQCDSDGGDLLITLAAAASALQHLNLDWFKAVQPARHLSALTGLTSLVLGFRYGDCMFLNEDAMEAAVAAGESDLDCAPALQGIACLTNLRSLQLDTFCSSCTPAAAGWHSRLTRLTHLMLSDFFFKPDPHTDVGPATSDAVAAAVQQLPALRSFVLCFYCQDLHHPNFLGRLASATHLQRLSFEVEDPCAAHAQALSSLQALSALEVDCYGDNAQPREALPISVNLQWVSTLTNLQQLAVRMINYQPDQKDLGLLLRGQVLKPLLLLHTLELRAYVDSDALVAELLAAVEGRLERLHLDLCRTDAWSQPDSQPDSSLLVGLTRLQVLGVHGCGGDHVGVQQLLRLPPSLRCCYLPQSVNVGQLQQLQAAHPGVAFRRHWRTDRWDSISVAVLEAG